MGPSGFLDGEGELVTGNIFRTGGGVTVEEGAVGRHCCGGRGGGAIE